jgi:hypothetical protein
MRVLLFLFILLSSVAVNAQNIMANKIFANSELYIPLRDTNWIPSRNGAFTMRPADGMIYTYNSSYTGAKWRLVTVTPGGGGGGAVNSVFGRSGDVVALSGDYSSFYPLLTGSYSNPAWITSLGWSKLTGTPTTLSGYGITDPVVLTSGSYANPAWISSLAWSKITGTPITLSGYGITTPIAIADGGTGQTTANAARNALLPTQTGNSGKYLKTNGTDVSWETLVLGDSTASRIRRGTFAQRPATPDTGAVFYQTDRRRGLYSYDAWNTKWRFHPEAEKVEIWENFLSGSSSVPKVSYLVAGTGAGHTIVREKKNASFLRLSTGTTTTGYSSGGFNEDVAGTTLVLDSMHLYREWLVRIPVLSDGTDQFQVMVGWAGHQSQWAFSSCIFVYTHTNNGGRWETRTRKFDNTGNMTNKDTGVPVVANTWTRLAIETDGYGQVIRFYINDVLVTTHSTANGDNIPMPNSTVGYAYNFGIAKGSGTTARFFEIKEVLYYINKKEN